MGNRYEELQLMMVFMVLNLSVWMSEHVKLKVEPKDISLPEHVTEMQMRYYIIILCQLHSTSRMKWIFSTFNIFVIFAKILEMIFYTC